MRKFKLTSMYSDKFFILNVLKLLKQNDKIKYLVFVFTLIFISLLDLIGIFLISIAGYLASSRISDVKIPLFLEESMKSFNLDSMNLQQLVILLLVTSGILLVLKSLLNTLYTYRMFNFLANCQINFVQNFLKKLLSLNIYDLRKYKPQEYVFILSHGTSLTLNLYLGFYAILASEIVYLTILMSVLFTINKVIVSYLIILFVLLGYTLQKFLKPRINHIGREISRSIINSSENLISLINSYKILHVSNKKSFFVDKMTIFARDQYSSEGRQYFFEQVPKSVYEIAIVLAAFSFFSFLNIIESDLPVLTLLIIFVASSIRMLPSLLRINGVLIGLSKAKAESKSLFEINSHVNTSMEFKLNTKENKNSNLSAKNFSPLITFRGVTFGYPDSKNQLFKGLHLTIQPGFKVAIIGETGVGKSTFVDLLLGIIEPSEGQILISNENPEKAVSQWPDEIQYVPQENILINASVIENVAFGLTSAQINIDNVVSSLNLVDLGFKFSNSGAGLSSLVKPNGSNLSGGERQRLAIARALYSKSNLLILDEATSALDESTETKILDNIRKEFPKQTLILITHRINSVSEFDLFIHLSKNSIDIYKSFSEVPKTSTS